MPQVPGNTIFGAGGYGSYPGNLYRDRYDWIIMPDGEVRHLAASFGIGVITRNPFVSASVGIFHGLYHLSEYMYTDTGHFRSHQSPRGGGPGRSLTSTNPRPSVEEVGRLLSRGYRQHSGR